MRPFRAAGILSTLLPLLLLWVSPCQGQSMTGRPQCPSPFAWIRDPTNCRRFWRCNWGVALGTFTCAGGTVFSDKLNVCVFQGSEFDDCPETSSRPITPAPPPRTSPTTPFSSSTTPLAIDILVNDYCSRYRHGLLAHPEQCQSYFNCSKWNGVMPGRHELYLDECPYPLLFNRVSQTCQKAWTVYCEDRRKPDSACDYRINTCNTSQVTTPTAPYLPFSIYEYCARNQTDRLVYPTECQLYYDCSKEDGPTPTLGLNYLVECASPLLYDDVSETCQESWRVNCGSRRRPLTACDYRINTCNTGQTTTPTAPYLPFSIYEYCARNQTDRLVYPTECQLYYDCSKEDGPTPTLGLNYLVECASPLLYDDVSETCQESWRVNCGSRRRPLTACDYRINTCNTGQTTTTPTAPYLPFSIYEYCARNQTDRLVYPTECQLYYDCSKENGPTPTLGLNYLVECASPLLYDDVSETCQESWRVNCGSRKRPLTACDYRINTCNTGQTTTTPTAPYLPFSIYEYCARNQTDRLVYPTECQLYYDCSKEDGPTPTLGLNYLVECASPLLYDDVSETCQESWRVNCGSRKRPLTECDYRINTCNTGQVTTPTAPYLPFSIYEYCARNQTDRLAYPTECQLYYDCSKENGPTPTLGLNYLVECASPLLYDDVSETCQESWRVNCGSRKRPLTECDYRNNTCNTNRVTTTPAAPYLPFSIYEYCARNQTDRLVYPTECQLYYDCSKENGPTPTLGLNYLVECASPLLYDDVSETCQESWRVNCGSRRRPLTACDYRRYRCAAGESCQPCDAILPSCEGRADGKQALHEGQWRVAYMICRAGRTMKISQCGLDIQLEVPMMFSPLTLDCENLYQVPVEHGGRRPNCNGRSDSFYPADENRPDLFYVCEGGRLSDVRRCPPERPLFDARWKICVQHWV